MADIVMAISGEKLVPVKIESKDDYCEHYSRINTELKRREDTD